MSNPLQIAGTAEPIECGFDLTVRRGPGGGTEQTRMWVGEPNAVAAKVNDLLANGAVMVRAYQAPNSATATVSAQYGRGQGPFAQDEVAQETISIRFNEVPLELHRHPHFVDISSARIKALDDAANENNSSVPTAGAELAYWTYKIRGVNTIRTKLPVVTYTRTASTSFGENLVVADTGKIFDTTQVSNFIGSPILFSIPNAPIGISAGTRGTFVAGWQQDTQLEYLANGNVQLIEVYEFGLWEIAADPGDGFNLYVQG